MGKLKPRLGTYLSKTSQPFSGRDKCKIEPPNCNPCVLLPPNQTSDVDLQCEVCSSVFINIYMHFQLQGRPSSPRKRLRDLLLHSPLLPQLHSEIQGGCFQTECREPHTD